MVYYNGVKAGINIQKISNTVKASVRTLGIEKQVILAHMMDTQSLRARGSMALNILGTSDTTIIKFGRWTRFKFLQIHEQTSHLRKRVLTEMMNPLPFNKIGPLSANHLYFSVLPNHYIYL